MAEEKLMTLREQYKDRNLLEELSWGRRANFQGYMTREEANFINWLCDASYSMIKKLSEVK